MLSPEGVNLRIMIVCNVSSSYSPSLFLSHNFSSFLCCFTIKYNKRDKCLEEVELKHNFKAAIKVKGPWRAHKYPDSVSLSKRSPSTDSKSLKLRCGICTQFNTMTTDGEMLFFHAPHPTAAQRSSQKASVLWKPQQHYRAPYVTKLLSAAKLNPAENWGKEREYVRIKMPHT